MGIFVLSLQERQVPTTSVCDLCPHHIAKTRLWTYKHCCFRWYIKVLLFILSEPHWKRSWCQTKATTGPHKKRAGITFYLICLQIGYWEQHAFKISREMVVWWVGDRSKRKLLLLSREMMSVSRMHPLHLIPSRADVHVCVSSQILHLYCISYLHMYKWKHAHRKQWFCQIAGLEIKKCLQP